MAGNTAAAGTTVTTRVLAILDAFDPGHRALTLTEIADRSGLARPTAHRLIAELAAWGALRRDGQGRYVIGRRLWDLGLLAPVQTGLRETASPFLHDLYGATLATVHLAVRDETSVLYLDTLRGHASVPIVSRVGSRLPLHATGVGKVLLAYAPDALFDAVVAKGLERYTPHTIVAPGHLRRALTQIRRTGVAFAREEMTLGSVSVASPLFDGRGEVIAALSIVSRVNRVDPQRLAPAVRTAAMCASRELRDAGLGRGGAADAPGQTGRLSEAGQVHPPP
jgi:DNA-binding IclR family transcriptional regulator